MGVNGLDEEGAPFANSVTCFSRKGVTGGSVCLTFSKGGRSNVMCPSAPPRNVLLKRRLGDRRARGRLCLRVCLRVLARRPLVILILLLDYLDIFILSYPPILQ
jgi:hypothetical protein